MPASIDTNREADEPQRLWIVSELYYPEETSTGYYMTRLAEGLADEFNVKVICGQPNYSARGIRAPKLEDRNGVEIFRAAGTTLNKNVIAFRLLNMLSLGLATFFSAILKFGAADRVLVVTTPPSLPFVVALAALLRGAQYTLLIHDNYPEIVIAVAKMREHSFYVRVINFFNRWLYKHTSRIVVVGRDMKDLLETKTAGLDIPIDVIANWAELESVYPAPRVDNAMLSELGLNDKFILLYAGNMGHPNDLTTIVGAADLLRDHGDIHFIFLGTGVKETWLKQIIADAGLTNITVLGPRPRSEQIDFLNGCDVALVSLVDGMRGVSMPSRTYNILAAGKPILALTHPGSELAMVIEEDEVGWHMPPGDPDAFSKVILQIFDDRRDLAVYGERARRSALEKYSFETALDKYRSTFGH